MAQIMGDAEPSGQATPRLWHNPRCSKSRAARALLEERGADAVTYLYLQDPPDRTRLLDMLQKLGCAPVDLVRRGEAAWKEAGLTPDADHAAIIELLLAHPILIERPILETADRAVVGRPPDAILALI